LSRARKRARKRARAEKQSEKESESGEESGERERRAGYRAESESGLLVSKMSFSRGPRLIMHCNSAIKYIKRTIIVQNT